MSASNEDVNKLVQQCHELTVTTGKPSRDVARSLTNELPDGPLLRRLAAEFLVDALARAARARTLEQERAAQAERQRQMAEKANSPEAAADRQRRAAEDEEYERRSWQMFHGVIGKALDRYAEDLKVRWSAELLDSTFAMGDGTLVTWGDATMTQHEERRQMFLNNAHANMEGAARHEVALRELKAADAGTLRELVSATV